ncbi:MAG: class II aldolase/adducin family protein [Burkholderiaceae bacterium]
MKDDADVQFDAAIGKQFLRYAQMVSRRGYIHNTLGNMAVRVPHPAYVDGVAYTKHAEVSLEEVSIDNIVITDIPSPRLLYGNRVTSVGHNLNREILRLRTDINAVIHVHDDSTIALFASGGFKEVGVISLDMPFILGKWPHYVDAHIDVEADVGPVAQFIQDTNTVVLLGHGVTSLGRNLSEAYHRLNSFTSEVRRNIAAEQLAAIKGTNVQYRSREEIDEMHRFAEQIIYPKRAHGVMNI